MKKCVMSLPGGDGDDYLRPGWTRNYIIVSRVNIDGWEVLPA